VNPLP